MHIVHPSWLLDSIAQFRRLDEDDYLLIPPTFEDPPPPTDGRSTTPPLPPTTNGTDPAPDASAAAVEAPAEEDLEEVNGDLDLGEIDWGQADRELDEFLDESSEDGGDSGNVSEAERSVPP